MLFLVWLVLGVASTTAQYPRWEYADLTRYGYDKILPRGAFDPWGNLHVVYGTENPIRSGKQLFYMSMSDAAGRFGSPIQATDTGTIVDSTGAAITPFVFRLDRGSTAHIAFGANVANRYNLYYVNNASHAFGRATLLSRLFRYDMAVDSSGGAHIVWIDTSNSVAELFYWASKEGAPPRNIATFDCFIPFLGCRIGTPEVEVSGGRVMVAFRGDTGSIYVTTSQDAGGFTPILRLPASTWPRVAGMGSNVDLRLRLAVDTAGTFHILAPVIDSAGGSRFMYVRHSSASTIWYHLGATLDTNPSEFEMVFDGVSRLRGIWCTHARMRPADLPKNVYAEIPIGAGGGMVIGDIGPLVNPSRSTPHSATGLAVYGERVAVPLARTAPSDSATIQGGLFQRTALRPEISYILPDAAPAGKSLVVETYGSVGGKGTFGRDGFRGDTVAMEVVNPADRVRIDFGPSVVSWNGRMVSTMVFVLPGASPGPVPIRLRVLGVPSNIDTFYVVAPQSLGTSGVLDGGGYLGGRRSRRGTLVVDSLVLRNGTYTVDTSDIDSIAPGNQGFLPLTIVSVGPIVIDSTATLSLSATGDTMRRLFGIAGPGGGGGGSGSEFAGGPGFAGGGGIVRGNDPGLYGITTGTGGIKSGLWNGGQSLAGAPGGGTWVNVPAGGGTGHPFGSSGFAGRRLTAQPIALNPGGAGGGSGGQNPIDPSDEAIGGGGGGGATSGDGGGDVWSSNGGVVVGNAQLVPIAGGSGGGGGGFSSGGYANGGGGGGALILLSYASITIDGEIRADGGPGVNMSQAANAAGGGGGAGGGVLIGAQEGIIVGSRGRVSAAGGAGGDGNARIGLSGKDGGDGGAGRVRIDADVAGPQPIVVAGSSYRGASTIATAQIPAQQGGMIRGIGSPGSLVRVFTRRVSAARWDYSTFRQTQVASDGRWGVTLGPDAAEGRLYVVAMQRVESPSSDPLTAEPAWVMSSVGGGLLGRPAMTLDVDTVEFPCEHFGHCQQRTISVANPGYQTNLLIRSARFIGPGSSAFSVIPGTVSVPAGGSGSLSIRFCPSDTGSFDADLVLATNLFPDSVQRVHVRGCGITGLVETPARVNLGDICPRDCRDIRLPFRNTGAAPLAIVSIASVDSVDLGLSLIDPQLPITLPPDGAAELQVRLCPRLFEPRTGTIRVVTNSIDSVTLVTVSARNAGPDPSIPELVDFGSVEIGSGDTCVAQVITIQNRSPLRALRLARLELLSRHFRLVDSLAVDTTIPPGGRISLRVSFCADTVGVYAGRLRMVFDGAGCLVDTGVALRGGATFRRGELAIVRPASRQMIFGPTLAGIATPTQSLVIRNVGTAPARLDDPSGRGRGATLDTEIIVDRRGNVYPLELAPGDSVLVDIRLLPIDEGEIEGVVLLGSVGLGWSDSVSLFGRGSLPGLYVSLPRLDFGVVRLGDSLEMDLSVGNIGATPLRLSQLVLRDSVRFAFVSASVPLPHDLVPGVDPIRLTYKFRPDTEGDFATVLTVLADADTEVVALVGRGAREHLATTPGTIDFGCRFPTPIDSLDAVTLSNPGTWPLRVDSIIVTGDPDFLLGSESWPHVIPPGGRRSYAVRYTPRIPSASARLSVYSSAPESRSIELLGRRCDAIEELQLRVGMQDEAGMIGEVRYVAVIGRMSRPAPSDIDYQIVIAYNPLVVAIPPSSISEAERAGTLSSLAVLTDDGTGRVRIQGTIAAGRQSDTLILIPVLPLLGPARVSPLNPVQGSWSAAGLLSITDSGSFTAIDCDSAGTVTIGESYALEQNRPNPFNPTTDIPFSIAFRERTRLVLYDNMGHPVRTLIDAVLPAGRAVYRLDATTLPSGIYYYELRAGRYRRMLRMVVIE